MIISDAELSAAMQAAVDANHRRAKLRAQQTRQPARRDMPTWACIAWTILLAAAVAACLVYAAN